MANLRTEKLELLADTLPLAFTDQGTRRPYLLLHGGAGAGSMAALAGGLARDGRSILPSHPGFDGQLRPEWFHRVEDLATGYLALIERLDLERVVLVGNSMGGWIAAEMALRQSPRLAALVLLNPVGIHAGPGEQIVDPLPLAPAERAALSFHDASRFSLAPAGPEAAAAMATNQQTLRTYAGEPFMHSPTLQGRLAGIALPTLVAWGASDRIVPQSYGRRFAAGIPGACFELVQEAGHFPHIEQPGTVLRLVSAFVGGL